MTPGSAEAPNRSRWMRAGRECTAADDWAGAIRAYAQGLMEQPLLGMHYAAKSLAGVTYGGTRPTLEAAKFSSRHTGIVQYTMGDGSVRALSVNTDADVLLRLGGAADGQIVSGLE